MAEFLIILKSVNKIKLKAQQKNLFDYKNILYYYRTNNLKKGYIIIYQKNIV